MFLVSDPRPPGIEPGPPAPRLPALPAEPLPTPAESCSKMMIDLDWRFYWSRDLEKQLNTFTATLQSQRSDFAWVHHSLTLSSSASNEGFQLFHDFAENIFQLYQGEGNQQPPLCWLPLWVVELGLVAESCTNIGTLYLGPVWCFSVLSAGW